MWWILLPPLALAGPKAEARRAARADPFSALNLDKAMRRVVPLVEQAAGRPFLTPPIVELSDEEVFGRMLKEENRLVFDAVMRATPPEVRKRMAAREGGVPAGVLGKYGIFEDKLFLCPDAITQAAKHAELPTHRLDEFVMLILAHELTHALHDQHVDLAAQIRGLDDLNALFAAQGTWEGLATWVQGQVSEALELDDAQDLLISLQGWSDHGLEESRAYPVWAIYGRGQQTIAWHFDQGGHERVWQVADRPPRRSAGLFRPEVWPAERPPQTLDYDAVLRGTEQVLTRKDWLVGITPLGEFELRGEAIQGHTEAELEQVMAQLIEAWALVATRPDRLAEVRVMVFADPDGPGAYLDLLRAQQSEQARTRAAMIGEIVEVRHEPFDQVPSDEAMSRVVRVAGLGGTASEQHSVWVVRGSTLVVITTEGFRPGLRLGWALDSVFQRLEATRAGEPLPEPGETPPP